VELCKWLHPPEQVSLEINELHLWRIMLPIQNDVDVILKQYLSVEETDRLNKFHFKKDKDCFVASRGALKDILARYINRLPSQLNIRYAQYGKPFLNNSNIHFNVSHSNQYILIAIAKHIPLGIDIEYCNQDLDFLTLAKNICSEIEYAKLSKLPIHERCLAFYRCWTRKEAFIKALGKGLYFPLNQVEVTFLPFEEPKLLNVYDPLEKDYLNRHTWQMQELNLAEDYNVTLVMQLMQKRKLHISKQLMDWTICC
jgi:4'-phosphopantetheinyl transferase